MVVAAQACLEPGHQGFDAPLVHRCQGCCSLWATSLGQTKSSCCSLESANQSAATDQLTCTSELLTGNHASHWDRRPFAEDACRSVVGSVMSHSYPICSIGIAGSGSVSVMTSSFGRASLTIAGTLFRVRYHCETRVCSVSVSNKRVTCFANVCKSKAVWSRRLRVIQMSHCK